MPTAALTPRGPFSLAEGIRFLEDFTPARYIGTPDGVLRLAFPADDGLSVVSAALRQEERAEGGPGAVHAEYTVRPGTQAGPGTASAGTADARSVSEQLARVLSLDVDGGGFPALAAGDPVAAGLMSRHQGLRPVCFPSPYEAAAWAVIGHRVRTSRAAAVKARIAERYGQRTTVAGQVLHAFPTPPDLRSLTGFPGLSAAKTERLRAVADAALSGELDAARLRAMTAEDALGELRALPGIGPFYAELILVRGAGHPDVFPRHERRLHARMAEEYGVAADGPGAVERLARIAERWRPYRSWVALLMRASA